MGYERERHQLENNDVQTHQRWLDAPLEMLEGKKELARCSEQSETNGACAGSGNVAALPAVDWLCLAATPTLAIVALLIGVLGGAPTDVCSAAQGASLLGGMVPMYLLMSAFHSAPWLKLISRRRTHSSVD